MKVVQSQTIKSWLLCGTIFNALNLLERQCKPSLLKHRDINLMVGSASFLRLSEKMASAGMRVSKVTDYLK